MKMMTFLCRFKDEMMEAMVQDAARLDITIAALIRRAVGELLARDGYDGSDTSK